MSTETGHQSRGGLKRHKTMRSGSGSHGARKKPGIATLPERSAKEQVERQRRSRLRLTANELGEVHLQSRLIEEWLDALPPLARENAELLLRQQTIDGRAAERALGYDDEAAVEDSEELHGFLHAVHFDREEDIALYRAARGRKSRMRSVG